MQKTEVLMLMQLVVLSGYDVIALPPFAALRHLIVSTASSRHLPITYIKLAITLETLSLGIFGDGVYADWSGEDIDVSSLRALKHVRIENFAPRRLHVPDGCLLHVVWDGGCSHDHEFMKWARVQSLWQEQSNRLPPDLLPAV